MARTDPQLKIRLPDDLKTRVEQSAEAAGRSINAEVVDRLVRSYAAPMLEDTRALLELLMSQVALQKFQGTVLEQLIADMPDAELANRPILVLVRKFAAAMRDNDFTGAVATLQEINGKSRVPFFEPNPAALREISDLEPVDFKALWAEKSAQIKRNVLG